MAFKVKRTGHWYSQLTVPGYGELPRMSLGTTRKSDADALEKSLREVGRRALHDPGLHKLLDALRPLGRGRSGRLSPADLHVAVRHPDGPDVALARLLRRLDDPPLTDSLAALATADGATREDRLAAPTLVKYAAEVFGPHARVSALADEGAVRALLLAVERGEKKLRNSVVRYEKTSLVKVLDRAFGRAERDRLAREANYKGTDDRRRIREDVVTPAAVRRLCDELDAGRWQEGDEAASVYVRLAVTTGATVRPLSETLNKHWTAPAGEGLPGSLFLSGTKRVNAKRGGGGRDRALAVPPALVAVVEEYFNPDFPDRPLFPLRYDRFSTMWGKARARAKLTEAVLDGKGKPTPLRPHDLRRVFSMFAERAGLERTKISGALGHYDLGTTDTYLRRVATVSGPEADRVVAQMLG